MDKHVTEQIDSYLPVAREAGDCCAVPVPVNINMYYAQQVPSDKVAAVNVEVLFFDSDIRNEARRRPVERERNPDQHHPYLGRQSNPCMQSNLGSRVYLATDTDTMEYPSSGSSSLPLPITTTTAVSIVSLVPETHLPGNMRNRKMLPCIISLGCIITIAIIMYYTVRSMVNGGRYVYDNDTMALGGNTTTTTTTTTTF